MDVNHLICRMLVLATLFVPLAAAPPAAAELRSGGVDDPLDQQRPNLEGRVYLDLTRAEAHYDDASGTLRLSLTYNKPAAEVAAPPSLNVVFSDEETADLRACDIAPLDAFEMHADVLYGPASVELYGYEGELRSDGQLSEDQRTVTYAFAHAALAGRNLWCVSGASGADRFKFFFAGHEPTRLTPRNAQAALRAELGKRFGESFTGSRRSWLKCPKEEIIPASEPDEYGPGRVAFAICEFQFRQGARYRGGGASVNLIQGQLVVSDLGSTTYTKTLRACSIRPDLRRYDVLNRRLAVSGMLRSRSGRCYDNSAAMWRDLHGKRPGIRRVGLHGTNRAGFEARVVFRCRLTQNGHRYTARCANRLGDKFRYSYTLATKPRSRPPASPSCHPSYRGACLDPDASDYDCAGGSGNGPRYTGRVRVVGNDVFGLDRDGDGVACET
jgi:hypothetical protein